MRLYHTMSDEPGIRLGPCRSMLKATYHSVTIGPSQPALIAAFEPTASEPTPSLFTCDPMVTSEPTSLLSASDPTVSDAVHQDRRLRNASPSLSISHPQAAPIAPSEPTASEPTPSLTASGPEVTDSTHQDRRPQSASPSLSMSVPKVTTMIKWLP